MYVNSLVCERKKWGESKYFRINSIVYMAVYRCSDERGELKMGMGKMRARFLEEGRKWKLSGFLHADDLVLWVESEKDLKVMA